MAESKKPRDKQPAAEAEVIEQEQEQAQPVGLPVGSGVLAGSGAVGFAAPVGGMVPDLAPVGAGASTLALGADVTAGLTRLAPTFGEVLLSVGKGVADSQEALDRNLIETAKELSKTKIQVVTDVIQRLNDDGLPDPDKSELITDEVSLINFMSPEVHEWKNVSISMDFEVGAIDSERGVQLKQSQGTSTSRGGASFWGFGGWFNYDSHYQQTTVTSHDDAQSTWATGQVKLDATLAPRRTEKFTAPSQVVIGPQIYFALGAITKVSNNGKEVGRSIPVTITVLKADGGANPLAPLTLDSDKFAYSFVDGAQSGFTGSQTNGDGQAKVIVSRQVSDGASPVKGTLAVRLGNIVRNIEIVL